MTRNLLIAASAALFSSAAVAGEYSGKEPIIIDDATPIVTFKIDSRLRYEYGDTSTLDDSNAFTWRNRIGMLTKDFNGFQAFVEYEGTLVANRDDYFTPGTELPTGQTPIADAESHELNQAWLSYASPDKVFSLKGGRQAIIIDNQRYVGGVAWRQNMQTFDAAGFDWAPSSDFVLSYDYVWRVNRIFGSETFVPPFTDFKGDSHLINAKFKNLPVGTLTTYVYSLDLPNVATPGVFSSNTFGAHLTGDAFGDATFWLEYAHQVDAYGSPFSYAANYVHGYLSSPIFGLTGKIGHEYLGSDNGRAFQFPLGTNHAFNGFADAFLVTPAGGLNDFYASIGKKFDCGFGLTGFYHYFWDDGFDISRGQEVDVVATMPLGKGFTALAKGAFLWGQGAQPDVTRVTLEVNYKY